ncbi:MAG: hypothetical protein ACTTIZ_00285 [Treponema sp.]
MKIIYKTLFLSLLFFACKMTSSEGNELPPKKTNTLEHTKWKAPGTVAFVPDIILDFQTDNTVREYIILSGKETKGREGSYKEKNKRVEIEWSKLISDKVSGVILRNVMTLEDAKGLKSTKYYKIGEY